MSRKSRRRAAPPPVSPAPAPVGTAPSRRITRWLRRIGWVLVGVLAAGLLVFGVVLPQIAQGRLLTAGTPAPAISLPDLRGATISPLGDAGARPVLLIFFDTQCSHCQADVPHICGIAADHPEILVAMVEARSHSRTEVADFVQTYGDGCLTRNGVEILTDPNGSVSGAYHVLDVPTAYLLKKGAIASAGLGEAGIDAAVTAAG